jgi:hypothetical protein
MAILRSPTEDGGGLLAANLAGASPYHCHGNQHEGGYSYQVSAVLAGEWEEKFWTFSSDHNGSADLCRLYYQNSLCRSKID